MKREWWMLLVLCLILSGCRPNKCERALDTIREHMRNLHQVMGPDQFDALKLYAESCW